MLIHYGRVQAALVAEVVSAFAYVVWVIPRKTIRQRFSAKLRELKEELRRRWHLPVTDLGKWLRSVVQGYFNDHAVPGNLVSLRSFRLQVIRRWFVRSGARANGVG